MNDKDMAMLIEAHLAREGDPLTRFVRSLPDDMRKYAEETMRLREDFMSNSMRLLSSFETREAVGHAEWLARHSHEVAFRWTGLMQAVRRWCEIDCGPVGRDCRR